MRRCRLWSYSRTYLAALVAIALTVTTMLYPEDAFASALSGLRVWWDIVFPALLPFFILSEILMGLGVVSMLGVLLEILFSVIIRMATVVGLVDLLATAVAVPLAVIGVSGALSDSVVSGLFEITIGTELCASAGAPLMQRVAMAGAIIAWSGLSVHGQVASVVHDTDIRIGPYLLARLAHAVLAFVYTMLLWNVSGGLLGATLPVLFSAVPAATPSFVLQRMAFAGIRALGFLGITLVLSAIVVGLCKIRRGCRG